MAETDTSVTPGRPVAAGEDSAACAGGGLTPRTGVQPKGPEMGFAKGDLVLAADGCAFVALSHRQEPGGSAFLQ